MANWQTRLRLKDIYHDKSLKTSELAIKVAERLRKMTLPANLDEYTCEERDDIAWEFEAIAEDADCGVNDFDCVMERLYNWADMPLDSGWPQKKLCWVETF